MPEKRSDTIANVLRDSGRFAAAVAPMRRSLELGGGAPSILGWLGLTLARSGNTDEARAILDRLQMIAGKTYVSPTSFVMVYLGLGDVDNVFVWIERSIDERDSIIIPIKTYPAFDPLCADPRFPPLVRKMNLEP